MGFSDAVCPAPPPCVSSAACAAGSPTASRTPDSLGVGVCWFIIASTDTIMLNSAPSHLLEFVRKSFGTVKKEWREGNVFKITYAGFPFSKAVATSKVTLSLLTEFTRVGYRLQNTFRTSFGTSDLIVLQNADKMAPLDAPAPQMWSIRVDGMNCSVVVTIGAPPEISEQLTADLSRGCVVTREKCDGNVKELHIKSSLSMWQTMRSGAWAFASHKTIAMMKTIEAALDGGWRIMDACRVGDLHWDSLTFAHESTPYLTPIAAPERRTSGSIVGIFFSWTENCEFETAVMNAAPELDAQIESFLEGVWGGKKQKQGPHEPYTRMRWSVNDGDAGGKQNGKGNITPHILLGLFVQMRGLGYDMITKFKNGYGFNVMMFRHSPDLAEQKDRAQYFGVQRNGLDNVHIVRPLVGGVVVTAIQTAIEKNWAPGWKSSTPPSDKIGDMHIIALRGCPWVGSDRGVLKAAFSGGSASALDLQIHINDAIQSTGAEFCAEFTVAEGPLSIYKCLSWGLSSSRGQLGICPARRNLLAVHEFESQ